MNDAFSLSDATPPWEERFFFEAKVPCVMLYRSYKGGKDETVRVIISISPAEKLIRYCLSKDKVVLKEVRIPLQSRQPQFLNAA